MTPDVIAVTASGLQTAEIAAGATGGRVVEPVAGVAETLRDAFRAGRPVVLIGAAGIAVRALAPLEGIAGDDRGLHRGR